MVTTVKLDINSQVKKELKELAAFQDKDPYIKTLKDQVTNQPAEVQDGRYANLDGAIYCKNHKSYSFWRPMLPSRLENKLVKFVLYAYGSVHHNIFYEITNRCSYMQSTLFHC
jgi:hypothetical protein